MPGAKRPLSNLEQLVMDVIWKRKSATVEDVREALSSRHFMKESTARTILSRLEDKGYLRHWSEGRTNIYAGVEPPANVAAKAVRQIIDRFCGGSVEQLLVGMVDNEVIDTRELNDLARKIARRRGQKGQ
jgi:BlaI family transcriptional regulator, penicillinase repressor